MVQFESDPRKRSKVLYNRRKGLFQSAYKLSRMTGVEVLIVIQNDKERRFHATGSLREEYLNGKLRGNGKEEATTGQEGSCSNGAIVGPLEETPSPPTQLHGQMVNRVLHIVGQPKSKRTLHMSSRTLGKTAIPEPVRKLLADKPVPVVLNQDIHNDQQ